MWKSFFHGRYGSDHLSFILMLISAIFVSRKIVWPLGVVLICYALFRMLSKNKARRLQELALYNQLTVRIASFFAPALSAIAGALKAAFKKMTEQTTRLRQSKDFAFVRCPACKNTLRLPKRKGTLSVNCPICKEIFIKKT